MPAREQPPPPKKASGENIEDWQRSTDRLTLRMQPEIVEMLRASAEREEMTLAEYVSWLESKRRLASRISQAERDLDASEEQALAIRLWREEQAQR